MQAIHDSLKGKPYQNQVHREVLCVSSRTGDGVEKARTLLDDMVKVKDYGVEVPLRWFKWHQIAKEMVAESQPTPTVTAIADRSTAMVAMDSDGTGGTGNGRRRISYTEAVQMAKACDMTVVDGGEEGKIRRPRVSRVLFLAVGLGVLRIEHDA